MDGVPDRRRQLRDTNREAELNRLDARSRIPTDQVNAMGTKLDNAPQNHESPVDEPVRERPGCGARKSRDDLTE